MIKAIVKGVIKLMISLVSILLTPIDSLISQYLPQLDSLINYVNQFFTYVSQFLGWIIDASFISQEVLSFIVIYYTFKLTFWIILWGIKSAIKWYNALKL